MKGKLKIKVMSNRSRGNASVPRNGSTPSSSNFVGKRDPLTATNQSTMGVRKDLSFLDKQDEAASVIKTQNEKKIRNLSLNLNAGRGSIWKKAAPDYSTNPDNNAETIKS